MNPKTFCVAPWSCLYVDSDNTIVPCCQFKNPRKYKTKNLEEYFYSDQMKQVRKDLLNGVKNKSCEKCWLDEEAGGDSLRQIYNRTLGLFGDSSMKEQIKEPKVENIRSFDLTLGNLCNLKCTMCSPHLSSQMLAEVNLNKELQQFYDEDMLKQSKYNWAKENDFVDWCNKHLPQSIHIKFTGGEPFIIPWIRSVLENIPDTQKSKCVLSFTSNLTTLNTDLFDVFGKFKEVWLSVSVEGYKETFEYIRHGHKWDTLTNNIEKIKQMKIPNLNLMINYVMQTPSYHSIIPMTEYFDQLQLKINPMLLVYPNHFHISALSKKAKKIFLEETENYNGYNKAFINWARDMTSNHMEQNYEYTKKTIKHLEIFDNIRKNKHTDIIPIDNLQ